jgi:hypothetical protein
LNTPNLGKSPNEAGKPYFWSLDWASANFNPSKLQYSYPLLALTKINMNKSGLFTKKSESFYKIQIAFLDQYDEDTYLIFSKAKHKNRNEIYEAMEIELNRFLSHLSKLVYQQDVDGNYWTTEAQLTTASITPNIHSEATRWLQKMFLDNNNNTDVFEWFGSIDKLYGVAMDFNIKIAKCPPEGLTYNDREYIKTFDRNIVNGI